jgi:putative transcriptional regulator
MLYMKLIERLKTYRLNKKITQEDLAKKLGVAFATVNRWFNGRSEPNEIQAYHIEKLLKKKKP